MLTSLNKVRNIYICLLDTIAILSYINMKYILEDNQKMLMKNLHNYNKMKNEKLKREKFNPKTIFKK